MARSAVFRRATRPPRRRRWPSAAAPPDIAVTLNDSAAATDVIWRPVSVENTFEGGSDGTTITTGNSGSTSGQPFDTATAGSGATLAYEADRPAHGTLGMLAATGVTAATATAGWGAATLPQSPEQWHRFYWELTVAPATTQRIARMAQDGTLAAAVRVNSARQLQIADAANVGQGTMTTAVTLNSRVRVEWRVLGHPTGGQIEVRLWLTPDSSGAPDETLLASNLNTFGLVNDVQWGWLTSSANVPAAYFDDVVAANTGWPGPAAAPTAKTLSDTGAAVDRLVVAVAATTADSGSVSDALAVGQPTWLTDTFGQFGTAESWADASTHGQWFVQFGGVAAGNGIGTEVDTGSTVLFEKPDAPTTPGVTHASLATSTPQFGANLDFTLDVKTVQQLRQNDPPNAWEVAWVVWAYTDNDHFYYFTLKPNGIELGKRHPAYAGGQRFLWTAGTPTLTLNTWNRIRVVQDGNVLSVFVDGTELVLGSGGANAKSFVDVGGAQADSPYLTGRVGLYNEDAWVRFDNVLVNAVALPDSAAAADSLLLAAQVTLADAAAAADTLLVDQGGIPKTLTDSGAAADSLRVTAAVPLADQGQAADQTQISVAVALPDVGQAVDQFIIPKQLLDSAAAVDTVQVAAQITVPDSGTAGVGQVTAGAAVLLADSGAAAEQLILAVSLADAGTGVDRLLSAAQVPLPESGVAADQFGTDQGAAAALADQATAADQLQVILGKLLGDQATAVDSLNTLQTRPLTDTATAADTLTPGVVAAPADQAAAADRLTLLALAQLPDSGQALDALVVITVSTYLRTSSREPAMATSSREQGHL